MTNETYKKATELLKQIDELERHVLAMKNGKIYDNVNYPITYPFTSEAYSGGIKLSLPTEIIDKFLLDYKEALNKSFEKLKDEFSKL